MDSLPADCAPATPDQPHRAQEEPGEAQAEDQERGPAESINVGRDVRDRERIGGLQCPRHHGHSMLLEQSRVPIELGGEVPGDERRAQDSTDEG